MVVTSSISSPAKERVSPTIYSLLVGKVFIFNALVITSVVPLLPLLISSFSWLQLNKDKENNGKIKQSIGLIFFRSHLLLYILN